MNTPKAKTIAILIPALLAGLAVAGSAAAQQAPIKQEKIEVTGSNIKRVDAEGPSVVQVITKEEIEKSGVQTVAELLRNVPAIAGGSLQDFNTGNGFAASTQSASLRGLGSIGTLVLLNGRRVAPSPNADPNTGQGQSYNLNNIPLSAIERIEILKDGGSAIYGSDAIAGVINFILRKDYKGAEVRATYGSSLDNTFGNYTITGTAGFGDLAKDRYNVLLTGEYYERDAVKFNEANGVQNDSYLRLANRQLRNNSQFSNIPNFFREGVLGNGAFTTSLPTDPRCPASQVIAVNAGCRVSSFDYIEITGKAERAGFLAKGTYEFSGTMQGTAEVSATRAVNNYVGRPPTIDGAVPPTWFNAAGQRFRYQLVLPVGHPDNRFTMPVSLRYQFEDMGQTLQEITNDAYRSMFALTGVGMGWDWEAGLLYSKTERKDVANGRLHFPTLVAAVNGGTYRFGATNNDPALLAALNPFRTSRGETDIKSLDLKGSRELMNLPGGPMAIALGAEFRRESFDIKSDPGQVAGDFIGIASTTVGASRNVKSFFAELSVPFAPKVETQLAVRFDKYSDYGNSTTPKFGIKWNPLSTLALRANYGESFRAPSLTQSSNSRVQSFTSLTDPVRCPGGVRAPGSDPEDCTGRTISSIFLPVTGLEPERSKSFSYGFIWSPSASFSLQSDLFEIRRRDQIDRFSAQQAINNEFVPNFIGGTVVRSTNPALFLIDANGNPIPGTGPVESAIRRFANLGETRVKGVDVEINSSMSMGGGKLGFAALATWTIRYDYQLEKGGSFVNNAGNFYIFETPRLRGNAAVTYSKNDWATFLRVNYTGGWDYTDPTVGGNNCYLGATSLTLAFLGRCQVASLLTLDIGGRYDVTKALTISGVIRNIENKKAPYDPNQTTLGFNPTYHIPQGANAAVTVSYKFK